MSIVEGTRPEEKYSFVGIFFFTLILFILACVISFYLIVDFSKQTKNLKQQLALEKEKSRCCALHDQCINSMSKTLMVKYGLSSGLSKWEAHYYSIIFDDFSKHFGIPWEVYPAIIRIESNFKCNVGSPKGAKGMMQLLEATGKEVADQYGIDYVPNQTLWNTTINLVLGCGYLSKNIKEKGLEAGVKCYLGGPEYLKSIKVNKNANKYIGEYKSTVWNEYQILSLVFKSEIGNDDSFNEIHPYKDSVALNTDLFADVKDTTKNIKQKLKRFLSKSVDTIENDTAQ